MGWATGWPVPSEECAQIVEALQRDVALDAKPRKPTPCGSCRVTIKGRVPHHHASRNIDAEARSRIEYHVRRRLRTSDIRPTDDQVRCCPGTLYEFPRQGVGRIRDHRRGQPAPCNVGKDGRHLRRGFETGPVILEMSLEVRLDFRNRLLWEETLTICMDALPPAFMKHLGLDGRVAPIRAGPIQQREPDLIGIDQYAIEIEEHCGNLGLCHEGSIGIGSASAGWTLRAAAPTLHLSFNFRPPGGL